MPTKPTVPVTIRASDATYTTGDPDMFTKDTKTPRLGPDMAEGYKVDTDAFPQSVFAQNKNYEDNVVDQYANWTKLGSNTADGDAHIVETDSGGDINVVGVNCADVRVTPNTGTDGIEVTTAGGSKGLEVLQDATSTDYGVYVLSTVGAAAPAIVSETVSNVGMLVGHGSAAGLSIGSTANGGVVGPSISMTSNTISPTDDSVGTMWNEEQNSIENVRMGMGASAGYPVIAKNASCYARSSNSVFVLTGSQTDQTIRSDFSFGTDQLPQAAAEVRVTIWGKVTFRPDQDNTIALKVRDKTVGGNPAICELEIQAESQAGSGLFTQVSATYSDTYTLPASGARTFDLVWSGDTTGSSGSFTGFVEIEQLRG